MTDGPHRTCALEGCTVVFVARRDHHRFCCDAHRAAAHKQHRDTAAERVPGRPGGAQVSYRLAVKAAAAAVVAGRLVNGLPADILAQAAINQVVPARQRNRLRIQ